jgi:DinB superfamily
MQYTVLIDQYAAGPELLREATAGMTRDQIHARPVPGKWSTLEVVCHIADFEIVGADRLKRVIAEIEPTLFGGDERVFAARLAYHSRDLEEELRLIEACRQSVTRILRTLKDEDFGRIGKHSEAGPLTLVQLLERATNHVPHHVKFIHEKRKALGI